MYQQPHKTASPEPLCGGSEPPCTWPATELPGPQPHTPWTHTSVPHFAEGGLLLTSVGRSLTYMTALTPSLMWWGRIHCQPPSRLGTGARSPRPALNPGPHLPGWVTGGVHLWVSAAECSLRWAGSSQTRLVRTAVRTRHPIYFCVTSS